MLQCFLPGSTGDGRHKPFARTHTHTHTNKINGKIAHRFEHLHSLFRAQTWRPPTSRRLTVYGVWVPISVFGNLLEHFPRPPTGPLFSLFTNVFAQLGLASEGRVRGNLRVNSTPVPMAMVPKTSSQMSYVTARLRSLPPALSREFSRAARIAYVVCCSCRCVCWKSANTLPALPSWEPSLPLLDVAASIFGVRPAAASSTARLARLVINFNRQK